MYVSLAESPWEQHGSMHIKPLGQVVYIGESWTIVVVSVVIMVVVRVSVSVVTVSVIITVTVSIVVSVVSSSGGGKAWQPFQFGPESGLPSSGVVSVAGCSIVDGHATGHSHRVWFLLLCLSVLSVNMSNSDLLCPMTHLYICVWCYYIPTIMYLTSVSNMKVPGLGEFSPSSCLRHLN